MSFHLRLQAIRRLYLQEALASTIKRLELRAVDQELNTLVPATALKQVAAFHLRGEVAFPVPIVLQANPFLLGYYRLLYGISQKEFYTKNPFGSFRSLEDSGKIPEKCEGLIEALCKSLIGTGEALVRALDELSPTVINELQLLTIGPQLRGSENTRIGQKATTRVRDLIGDIVKGYMQGPTQATFVLRNESDRPVLIEFSADPDVAVTEKLPSGIRPVLSMEIKGGADASNIHNRLGEAEKSHQKARNKGFREFWTIVNVDVADSVARQASPTTSRFFNLGRICTPGTKPHEEFRDQFAALIGIRTGDEKSAAQRARKPHN